MPRSQTGSAATAVVGAAAVAVLVSGAAYAAANPPTATAPAAAASPSLQVRATAGAMTDPLLPGGSADGSLLLRNVGRTPVELSALELRPATASAPGCQPGALAFALLSGPTASAPLVVPGRASGQDGVVLVGYTVFLSAQADPACRAAVFRSDLVAVDRAGRSDVLGTASATVAALPVPPAPTARATTATTAELAWGAPPDLPHGASWVVERTSYGATSGWTAACRSGEALLSGTSCTDSGLTPCTAYTYRVVAVVGRWRATSRSSEQVRTTPASG